ncbi:hypothetical protein QBC40DRAFT_285657 [Triangularia verruculosa]|uniref:AAA+ ATPase domain-containing protein n=1 Tax=Triangularia verruculosa TaxID=2587418 RepID=A0AAN6XB77_9PEZI|nr:hypothetical protein QBC40DRAFT_285657 [Triangularia verruculosa]
MSEPSSPKDQKASDLTSSSAALKLDNTAESAAQAEVSVPVAAVTPPNPNSWTPDILETEITQQLPANDEKSRTDSNVDSSDEPSGGGCAPPPAPSVFDNQLLRELQAQVADLQQQAVLERRTREQLEEKLMTFTFPVLSTPFGFESRSEQIGCENGLQHHRHLMREESEGSPLISYLDGAITAYETGLERLRQEEQRMVALLESKTRLEHERNSKEQEWQVERAALIKKVQELQDLQKLHPTADAATTIDQSKEVGPTLAQTSPTYETAQLNRVSWEVFKLAARAGEYVIDVLMEEPVVSFDLSQHWWWQLRRAKQGRLKTTREKAKLQLGSVSTAKQSPSAQKNLPERIRIHSKHIIKILYGILGNSFSKSIDNGPVVMVRPYKALTYHNIAIHQKLSELERRFGPKGVEDDSSAPTVEKDGKDTPVNKDSEETSTVKALEDAANQSSPVGDGEDALGSPREKPETNEPDQSTEEDELTSSTVAYEHFKCLVEFMDGDIQKRIDYLHSDRCRTVVFQDLWYLFKPGDEVIEQSRRQAYRVIAVTSSGHKVLPPWRASWDKKSKEADDTPVLLKCAFIDFDGKRLGPRTREIRIARFDGEKAITALEVLPLRFAEAKERAADSSFRQKLLKRGRMFVDVTGFKHMHYSGVTLDTREEVDSHVVVDFEEAFAAKDRALSSDYEREQPERDSSMERPQLQEDVINPQDKSEPVDDEKCGAACCLGENVHGDQYVEKIRNQEYLASLIPDNRELEPPLSIYPRALREINLKENAIPEEDLVIMSYKVFGFILRSRKWAQLDLTYLKSPETGFEYFPAGLDTGPGEDEHAKLKGVQSDTKTTATVVNKKPKTAFDELVLPKGHKEMVLSLIAQHFRDKESKETQQVDIVAGKGKGLIILLHGAPGVGKTTTAEGVAEMFRRPLFQITCGDLGTTAPEVEAALETHFTLASRWGCVLLLDEADVFLAARSKQDFKRNGLVSVFLRVLEYYTGILFLTTNRVGDFDEAFTSRIHISLYYPQLDLESTKAIFELNFKLIERRFQQRQRRIGIDRDGILKFALTYFEQNSTRKWNGRQIRNACQTALALAEFRAQGGSYERVENADAVVELKVEDLQTVATAYLQFMHYLDKVHGMDAEKLAKQFALRARELDLIKGWSLDGDYGRDGSRRPDDIDLRQPYFSAPQMQQPGMSYSTPQSFPKAPGSSTSQGFPTTQGYPQAHGFSAAHGFPMSPGFQTPQNTFVQRSTTPTGFSRMQQQYNSPSNLPSTRMTPSPVSHASQHEQHLSPGYQPGFQAPYGASSSYSVASQQQHVHPEHEQAPRAHPQNAQSAQSGGQPQQTGQASAPPINLWNQMQG